MGRITARDYLKVTRGTGRIKKRFRKNKSRKDYLR